MMLDRQTLLALRREPRGYLSVGNGQNSQWEAGIAIRIRGAVRSRDWHF